MALLKEIFGVCSVLFILLEARATVGYCKYPWLTEPKIFLETRFENIRVIVACLRARSN